MGLADLVVPDGEVFRAARGLVARYADSPALALRAAKQAIDNGIGTDLATGLGIERLHFSALFGTEDQKAGMHAFLAGGLRKVVFRGR